MFRENYETEKTVISDWIANYTTIASLAHEDAIIDRYFIKTEKKESKEGRLLEIIEASFLFAISQFMLTMFYVPVYYVYAWNVEDGK